MGRFLKSLSPSAYGARRTLRNLAMATVLALPLPAVAEETVLVALGDSLTQGFGLVPEDGFVPQLQRWLEDQGAEVRLINAGVSGDTTAGGLARIEWTLTPDVDGLIVALGGNDVLRGIDPAVSRANLDGILKTATEASVPVLLVGVNAPSNYGPDYKAAFDGIYPELAKGYGTLLYPDFLAALTAETDLAEALEKYMQPDAIHPNSAGVSLIVEGIGPSVLELVELSK